MSEDHDLEDWWEDDTLELGDRIYAMQTEIIRLRELVVLLVEKLGNKNGDL